METIKGYEIEAEYKDQNGAHIIIMNMGEAVPFYGVSRKSTVRKVERYIDLISKED